MAVPGVAEGDEATICEVRLTSLMLSAPNGEPVQELVNFDEDACLSAMEESKEDAVGELKGMVRQLGRTVSELAQKMVTVEERSQRGAPHEKVVAAPRTWGEESGRGKGRPSRAGLDKLLGFYGDAGGEDEEDEDEMGGEEAASEGA